MIPKKLLILLAGAALLAGCAHGPSHTPKHPPQLEARSLQDKIEQEIHTLLTGENAAMSVAGMSAPAGTVHKVRQGETALGIARGAGAPPSLILSLPAQDKREMGRLKPGDEIKLIHDGTGFVGIGLNTGKGWRVALTSAEPYSLRNNVSLGEPGYLVMDLPLRGTLAETLAGGRHLVSVNHLLSTLKRAFPDEGMPQEGWLRLRLAQPQVEGLPAGDAILISAALADALSDDTRFMVRIDPPGLPATYYDGNGIRLTPTWLAHPIAGNYRVTSGFNPARRHPITGRVRPHNGKDFAAPTGTPVLAASDGVVSFAGWRSSWGNLIVLQHADGVETRYAHLSRIENLAPGATVEQGAIIGRVGSTGLSSGPHLHFEVHANGRAQNPASFHPYRAMAGAGNTLMGDPLKEVEAYRELEEEALALLTEEHGNFMTAATAELLVGVGGPLEEDALESPGVEVEKKPRTSDRSR